MRDFIILCVSGFLMVLFGFLGILIPAQLSVSQIGLLETHEIVSVGMMIAGVMLLILAFIFEEAKQ